MIQKFTKVRVVDNSGAKVAKTFFVYRVRFSAKGLGGKILVSLRKIVPNNVKKLKKGDKFKAVIVQSRQLF